MMFNIYYLGFPSQDFIPLMASSIAAMVEGSGDVSFQRKCLDVSAEGRLVQNQAI